MWWLEQAGRGRGFQFSKLQEFYASICLSIVAQMKGTLQHTCVYGTVFFKHNIIYSSQLVCLFDMLLLACRLHHNDVVVSREALGSPLESVACTVKCVYSVFLTKKTLEQIAVTNSLFILLYLLHPPNHDDLPLFVDDSCSSLPLLPSVTSIFPLAAPLTIGITSAPADIENVIVAAVLNGIGQVCAS